MILAIDSASTKLIVALASDDGTLLQQTIATASEGERGIHDERLAIETEQLLKNANATPPDIHRIAIIIGPGSFTGLRIGLAFAKGLAFATNATLVPLTQHELLLHGTATEATHIIIPAYRPELYYVATSATPTIAEVKTKEELKTLQGSAIVATPIATELDSIVQISAAREVTAEQLVRSAKEAIGLTAEEISELEPYYVTDFRPTR